jgi:MGT family glycosyltransferase
VRDDGWMRVLFSFVGGTGHVEPMVPVTQALRRAGHEVAFAGNTAYLSDLAARGYLTFPATGYSFRLGSGEPAPGERLPQWWRPAPDRPVIYVTLGTEFAVEAGDVFDRLLAGLGQLPAEVVATVGREREPAELGPQSGHVHVEQWLPQWLLLPHTDLVVSHGGSGTVTASLAYGLPQLVVPMGADQLHNAARVGELGIGRTLPAVRATPAQIRDAAAAVLADPDTRAAADRMRREYAALPDAASTVPLLERLT